ncbi:MAG: tetratricopeptide repeat protein [Vulcanimicrobiota bacterium]
MATLDGDGVELTREQVLEFAYDLGWDPLSAQEQLAPHFKDSPFQALGYRLETLTRARPTRPGSLQGWVGDDFIYGWKYLKVSTTAGPLCLGFPSPMSEEASLEWLRDYYQEPGLKTYLRALAHYQAGRRQLVAVTVEGLFSWTDLAPHLYNLLGVLMVGHGDWDSALRLLGLADLDGARYNRARIHLALRQWEEARELLEPLDFFDSQRLLNGLTLERPQPIYDPQLGVIYHPAERQVRGRPRVGARSPAEAMAGTARDPLWLSVLREVEGDFRGAIEVLDQASQKARLHRLLLMLRADQVQRAMLLLDDPWRLQVPCRLALERLDKAMAYHGQSELARMLRERLFSVLFQVGWVGPAARLLESSEQPRLKALGRTLYRLSKGECRLLREDPYGQAGEYLLDENLEAAAVGFALCCHPPDERSRSLVGLARVYRRLGQADWAATMLERSWAHGGQQFGAHRTEMARHLLDFGSPEKVAEYLADPASSLTLGEQAAIFEKLLTTNPQFVLDGLKLLGEYGLAPLLEVRARLALGHHEKALQRVEEIREGVPVWPALSVTEARVWLALGKPEEAARVCRQGLEQRPRQRRLLALLGAGHQEVLERPDPLDPALVGRWFL